MTRSADRAVRWDGLVGSRTALAFGFVPIYALLALSPYYYFALAMLPLMAVGLPRVQ